jgi:hypothetical protein
MTTTAIPLPDLAAMRDRCEKAAKGPWTAVRGRSGRYSDWEVTGPLHSATGTLAFQSDAEFIASAREDTPRLLDEVNRLRARVDELESEGAFLEALRAAGVDNWVGYDHAIDLYRAAAA